MPRKKEPTEQEQWLALCERTSHRRWTNDFEKDFFESILRYGKEWTENREKVVKRTIFETNEVGSIAGYRVSDLMTGLRTCVADLTSEIQDLLKMYEGHSRVAWRDAKVLLHWAERTTV